MRKSAEPRFNANGIFFNVAVVLTFGHHVHDRGVYQHQ